MSSSVTKTWYICKYCLRAFTNNDEMVAHKRSQHLDKNREKKISSGVNDQTSDVKVRSSTRGKRHQSSVHLEEAETPKAPKSIKIETKTEPRSRLSSVRRLNFDDVELPESSGGCEDRGETEISPHPGTSTRPDVSDVASSTAANKIKTRVSKRGKISAKSKQSLRNSSSRRNSKIESEYSTNEEEANVTKKKKSGKLNSKRTAIASNKISNGVNSSHTESHKREIVISRRVGRTHSSHSKSASTSVTNNNSKLDAHVTLHRRSESLRRKSVRKDTLTLNEICGRLSVVAKPRKSNAVELTCRYCGEKFTDSDKLKLHEENEEKLFLLESEANAAVAAGVHRDKSKAISVRPQTSNSSWADNLTHRKCTSVKSKLETHPCDDCSEDFTTSYFLKKHRDKVHSTTSQQSESEPESLSRRNSYSRVKSQWIIYTCLRCDEEFTTEYFLKKHRNRVHTIPVEQSESESESGILQKSIRSKTSHGKQKEQHYKVAANRLDIYISDSESENISTTKVKSEKSKNTFCRNSVDESESEPENAIVPAVTKQAKNQKNLKPFCDICETYFCSTYSLKRHRNNAHLRKDKKGSTRKTKVLNNGTNEEGAHKCDYCPASFDRLDILMCHVNQIHPHRKGH